MTILVPDSALLLLARGVQEQGLDRRRTARHLAAAELEIALLLAAIERFASLAEPPLHDAIEAASCSGCAWEQLLLNHREVVEHRRARGAS